ncbi:MAG: GtrA family protein, partial [Clostridia bacterium]|nr:GtrA family protein [Clostridia bacterium]
MRKTVRSLYQKHGDILRYLAVGGITTVINLVSFWILNTLLALHYNIANVLAQLLAITFAFLGNKWFVFRSQTEGVKALLMEASRFALSRLVTMLFSVFFMRVAVGTLSIDANL